MTGEVKKGDRLRPTFLCNRHFQADVDPVQHHQCLEPFHIGILGEQPAGEVLVLYPNSLGRQKRSVSWFFDSPVAGVSGDVEGFRRHGAAGHAVIPVS